MVHLVSSPRFLEHDTGGHPECAERLAGISRHLGRLGKLDPEQLVPPVACDPAALERVHTAGHVARVRRVAESGGGMLDPDTICSPRSYAVALDAAGSACALADRVLSRTAGSRRAGLALVRPPGHHACADRAMGFCLFNNVAVLARWLQDRHGLERVAIVDWDVHHGNGTQEIFWEDGSVFYFSMHRWPFYPGSGSAEERGAGPGLGTTLNLPLPFGTPREEVLARFEAALAEVAAWGPDAVLVSAGFDAYADDPIGGLGLEVDDFRALTRSVARLADRTRSRTLLSLLEGGYHLGELPRMVAAHLEELEAWEGGTSP